MKEFRVAAIALCVSTAALLAGPQMIAPAFAADPLGTWYTADNDSQVRIVNCGGALCGSLIWLKEPNDPDTGKPKLDKHNADSSKQSRPLLGALEGSQAVAQALGDRVVHALRGEGLRGIGDVRGGIVFRFPVQLAGRLGVGEQAPHIGLLGAEPGACLILVHLLSSVRQVVRASGGRASHGH